MRFRAQRLLERRRLEEERALEGMAHAARERARAEEEQARLDGAASAARAQLEKAPFLAATGGTMTAAQGQATDRFRARLETAAAAAAKRAEVHRHGPLEAAKRAETQARVLHDQARQKREVLERLKERAQAAEHKAAEQRGEAAAGETAATSRWRRQ